MPRPELIFLNSANGDGCNVRRLCKAHGLIQVAKTKADGARVNIP